MTPVLLALLALLAATFVAFRLLPGGWSSAAGRALDHRRAPLLIGLLTAAACWWVAGRTLDVEPISTDEAAYLLQAEIFAHGQVTAPGAPIPEFFEQPWVLVTPRIVAKYPPGHSLLLAPGVALGLPWLMPLLLNVVSGALLFALLRRAIGAPAALLAWGAWVLSGMAMAWQTSYFSEVSLLACWLGAGALVWRWLDGASWRPLAGAGALAAFGASTRPLSILLLGLPLAVVVLGQASRRARWRELWPAVGVAAAGLLAIPLWNHAATGDAWRSPLRAYTETYIPWDRLGFAIDSTPPLRATPTDLQAIAAQLAKVHREHTLSALPRTVLERADRVRALLFYGWRWLLAGAVLAGIWRLAPAARLMLACAGVQFVGHAVWGHQAGWTIYYAESAAFWFIPGAVGLVCLIVALGRRLGGGAEAEGRAGLVVLLAAPVLIWLSFEDSAPYREWRQVRAGESRAFAEFVRQGPPGAIYFVRYGEARSGRPGLIRNDPFLATARAWVVYDLGPKDQELLRAAPGRTGYLVDEATRSVTELPRAPSPGGVPTP